MFLHYNLIPPSRFLCFKVGITVEFGACTSYSFFFFFFLDKNKCRHARAPSVYSEIPFLPFLAVNSYRSSDVRVFRTDSRPVDSSPLAVKFRNDRGQSRREDRAPINTVNPVSRGRAAWPVRRTLRGRRQRDTPR